MTHEEAARILDPDTTREALNPYADSPVDRMRALDEACRIAAAELRNRKTGEALTLEQLLEMDGQPVWVTPAGFWALVIAKRGQRVQLLCNDGETVWADKEIELVGPVYAYPPAQIDREAWEPCGLCKSCGNCTEAGKASGEKINYAHPCHSCLNGDNFKPVGFCRYCGRPLTEEAWAELEKRMGVR